MNVIENDHIRVSFSADGNLESLVAKSGSREYLSEDSDGPFTIWHGFAEGYRFRSDEKSGACIHPPDPAAIAAGAFLPSHLADVAVQDDYISLRYRDASSSLTAVVEVKLSGRESTWSLTVSNEGSEVAEFMADFPRWSGIGLSRDAGGKMLAVNQAGYVGTIWHHRGGLYGNSFRQSAQFSCLFEEDSGDIGLSVHNFFVFDRFFHEVKNTNYRKVLFHYFLLILLNSPNNQINFHHY